MDSNSPLFNEKDFLEFFQNRYEERHGGNIQYINEYTFSLADMTEYDKSFNDCVYKSDTHTAFIIEYGGWFKEAKSRKLIETQDDGFNYIFTPMGYKKALQYKYPVKSFCKEHWKWLIPVILGAISAALKHI